MEHLITSIPITGIVLFSLLSGCSSRDCNNSGLFVERSPELEVNLEEKNEPEDSDIFLEYTPKASFTSIRQMEANIPVGEEESILGLVNAKFLKGCYYTGKTSTPFLASFAERWNKAAFLRRFVNAEELFERENSNCVDSVSTETIRGTMPLLSNEYELAFRNTRCRSLAKKLVGMLTTIDYIPEETEMIASIFSELVNVPFDTPDFLSLKEKNEVEKQFWELYDKTKYVSDYVTILKKRLAEDVDYDELYRLSIPLQKRYVEAESFDAKCVLALEMACYDFPYEVDYLGELIEDGRYSKYLFEVWISWRLRAQAQIFGISTWSEIPDNLYDNARLLVAKAYVRHILDNPSDNLAKLLLMNLIYTDNLHRKGSYFGNESMGAELALRTAYFLPEKQ